MNLLTIFGKADWIFKLIKSFMMFIDEKVYGFVEKVYELLIQLSEAGIFSQATIQTFTNRIYVFLGLIMVFRVSISLVNYIINPANFKNEQIGGKALLKNIAYVLVGIVLIPYIFEAAFGLQRIVLKDNVIGNLILGLSFDGTESTGADTTGNALSKEDKDASYYAQYGGKIMAFQVFSSFFTFNREIASNSCVNKPVLDDGTFNTEACGGENAIGSVPFDGGTDANGNELSTIGDYMAYAYGTGDFRTLANADLASVIYESTEGDYELFDYSFLLSTIAGLVIIYLLLTFCIDIAVRSVKLGFLQLIAPVPLVMKIAPTKEAQGRFDKWVKECISTYLDLFTRLAALYFAIFIIAAISREGVVNIAGSENDVSSSLMVKVFIIFAALFFAKQIPLLIADLVGGDKEKMQSLSKKLGATGGALVGAGAAYALGTAANRWAQSRAIKNKADALQNEYPGLDRSDYVKEAKYGTMAPSVKQRLGYFGRSMGGMLFQGASAAGHGAAAGYKAGDMGIKNAYKAGTSGKTAAREGAFKRESYRENNYGYGERIGDYLDRASGVVGKDASVGMLEKEGKKLAKEMDDYNKQEVAARNAKSNALNELARKYDRQAITDVMDKMNKLDEETKKDPDYNVHKNQTYNEYYNEEKNKVMETNTIQKYCNDNNITIDQYNNSQTHKDNYNNYIENTVQQSISNGTMLSREDYNQLSYVTEEVRTINNNQRETQDKIDKNNKLQTARIKKNNK